MPIRPVSRKAHRAALLLVEAVTQRRVRAQEEILKRPDMDAVALETARLAAYLGPGAFRSKRAFLENLRHAVDALDAADAKRTRPSPGGTEPDSPPTS